MAFIYYETAWNPATEFYLHVSKQYDLSFKHEFADEGEIFIGYEEIVNGENINKVRLNWNSPEGDALRLKLSFYKN